MNTVLRTAVFDRWLGRLKDVPGKAMIIKRIRSAERGNLGDCMSAGTKSRQQRDIMRARMMMRQLKLD